MLRMTANASSEVLHPCSPVLGFLTRDHEGDFTVASSTSAMMSLIRARTRALAGAHGRRWRGAGRRGPRR